MPPVLAGQERAQPAGRATNSETIEEALGDFLATRRWFGGRGFRLTAVHIEEAVALGSVYMLVARVEYADRDAERYVLPLATVTDSRYVAPHAVVATLRLPEGEAPLVDAMEDGPSARALLAALVARTRAAGVGGTVDATPLAELRAVPEGEPANISAQHAAAAVRYGDRYLLKMFRRLQEGRQPGARARPLPERARAGPDARHRRRDRIQPAPGRAGHARRAAGLRPERGHGLGARARASCGASSSAC